MNLIDQLAILGLNGRQGKVYLALLQLGSASAIELAKATKYKHPTVYDVLDVLKEKQLVSESQVKGRKVFTAEDPELLRDNEERRRGALEDALPSLRDLYLGGTHRPRIHLYEGEDGIRAVHAELLSVKSKEYFYFGSVGKMFKTTGEEGVKEFYNRRISRGIRSYAIRVREKESDIDYMRSGEQHLRQVRYLPKPITEDIADFYIYDDKIAIRSALKENYAVVIESRELTRLMKVVWQCIWEVAEEA